MHTSPELLEKTEVYHVEADENLDRESVHPGPNYKDGPGSDIIIDPKVEKRIMYVSPNSFRSHGT
jgi:hypothetical protein